MYTINHSSRVQTAWKKLENNYTKLHTALDLLKVKEGDMINFYHLSEVLNLPKDIVQHRCDSICFTCIDERAQLNLHNAISIGVPGNFCLEQSGSIIYINQIIKECIANSIHKIKLMPHAKCGAVNLILRREYQSKNLDVDTITDKIVNRRSIKYAKNLAKALETEAKRLDFDLEIQVEFIKVNQIKPKNFHNAVGSVINITDPASLDFTKLHLDPNIFNHCVNPMFNISGFGKDEDILNRILLSIDIAFGEKGLSNYVFSLENPYLILLVVDSPNTINRARNIFLPALKEKLQNRHQGEIVQTYLVDVSDIQSVSYNHEEIIHAKQPSLV